MGTINVKSKVEETLQYIRSITEMQPKIAIVLGTGMHSLIEMLTDSISIPYHMIPHMPISTVQSHKSAFYFGWLEGKEVVLVAGRFHYYEGYDMDDATYYIHVLHALGVRTSIMTSASGGLNPHYKSGEIVAITDHINLFPSNPLRGLNDDSLGPRFPDLMKAYPKCLIDLADKIAKSKDITLKHGIYLGWQGPSLETPAEYKMAHLLGADLVGMSTIPEVIINKYRNINTLALTIVSNVCYPISALTETTVEEVIDTVNKNALLLKEIIVGVIAEV